MEPWRNSLAKSVSIYLTDNEQEPVPEVTNMVGDFRLVIVFLHYCGFFVGHNHANDLSGKGYSNSVIPDYCVNLMSKKVQLLSSQSPVRR